MASEKQGDGTGTPVLRRFLKLATVDTGPLRRHRDFRLLFVGQGISMFGTMIRFVALPFQVYHLTHSSLAVGALGPAEILPILVFAFVGGALADAVDRRLLVLVTDLALAAVAALLVVNATLPAPQLWFLYVAAALMGAFDAVQRPALNALLPRLVTRDEITAAGALNSLRGTLGMIAGPALGGLLIAALGLPLTYGIDVVTFLVSMVTLLLMREAPPPADAERPSLRSVVEGLRYARSRQELLGTYLVDMVAMFFGMPTALFPAIASQYGGAGVLGFFYAAPAAGSFLITATSGWANHVHRHGRAIVLAAIAWGLAVTAFGFSHAVWLSLVLLAAAGAADMVSGLFRSVIWNQTIPDALRGRLAGIELISYSTGPAFGDMESGLVATLFSVRASVVSGGVLCVVGAALMAFALPAFWRYDNQAYLASHRKPAKAPVGT